MIGLKTPRRPRAFGIGILNELTLALLVQRIERGFRAAAFRSGERSSRASPGSQRPGSERRTGPLPSGKIFTPIQIPGS